MTPSPPRGIALIVFAAILWGTTGTAQSFAPLSLSSYWVGTARLFVSGCFFVVVLGLIDRQSFQIESLKALSWPFILTAALSMAVYNLTFFAGVRAAGVAIGTAIALGSGPVWAGLLQALWTRRLPGKNWWFAVTVAVFGLFLAMMGANSTSDIPMTGIVLCLASGLGYAVYALATKRLVADTAVHVSTAVVFTVAAGIAMPLAFVLKGLPEFHAADIPILLWLGVVATGVAYLLFGAGLRHVSSATGVALALVEPIAAVVLAILVIGETPSTASFVGMAIVFVGLCLIVRAEIRAQANLA